MVLAQGLTAGVPGENDRPLWETIWNRDANTCTSPKNPLPRRSSPTLPGGAWLCICRITALTIAAYCAQTWACVGVSWDGVRGAVSKETGSPW